MKPQAGGALRVFMRSLWILFVALPLVACSKPRIDASTTETLAKSMVRVRESVPQDKRQKFDQAISVISFKDLAEGGLMGFAAKGADQMQAEVKARLNGKNAEEIMAEADDILAERKAKERAQAIAEIKELEQKKAKAVAERAELAKFEVTRSRFRIVQQQFFGPKPYIELGVKNGTSTPVSRAYFRGTVASPGRAVPWIREEFNYSISGGLEPGESASWNLAPNQFSAWAKDAPKDAVMTVEVLRLDGPDEKTAYNGEFSVDDEKRLASLRDAIK